MNDTITLGEQTIEVAPIPLGRLKKLLPAFNRAGLAFKNGRLDEVVFDDIVLVLSAGTGKTVEEVELLPATMEQLSAALEVVAKVAGLETKVGAMGEGQASSAAVVAAANMPGTPGAIPGATSTPG
ncbi:hypothetical protein [Rhizobacter sp. Root16D2]|uniref:hypothetical protein n=1 Tax=Rhizobacter sp. Root16D2 TaxID=1736479 RepID=UPI0007008BBE|nr:hypothetical protein [Rhizobacter sp. Root16D2]KRB18648.1 hypothetical protein ASE08_05280 [Rhizobacter sp. Root16D2]